MPIPPEIQQILITEANRFNRSSFIEEDPISLPSQFDQLQDKEIIGFWVAMLAWGQRKTILAKGRELVALMEGQPYRFILDHSEADRARFLSFKHRTFNTTDTLYFLEFFQHYYRRHETLETAFTAGLSESDEHVGPALIRFHDYFFSLPEAPSRTRKHVATPIRKSTCKRLNMFLRWMVRSDDAGVDFGCWRSIRPDQLLMPLDVHVDRVARRLGLIKRKQTDWKAALELTRTLKEIDPSDPVRFDYALFGLGVLQRKEWRKP